LSGLRAKTEVYYDLIDKSNIIKAVTEISIWKSGDGNIKGYNFCM
jgi:hypothetical protein